MLRSIAIVIALALCSLSGSSSAYAQGSVLKAIDKSPTARKVVKKLISAPVAPVWIWAGEYACAHHYRNVIKECSDQARPGDVLH
jgi:hypothetical protein